MATHNDTQTFNELGETYLTDEEQVELSLRIDEGQLDAAKRYLVERVRALIDDGTVSPEDLQEVCRQLCVADDILV